MSVVDKILGFFLGSKSGKDMKSIAPIIQQIQSVYPSIEAMSFNELRDESDRIKSLVSKSVESIELDIKESKKRLENGDTSLDEKEKIGTHIDKQEKVKISIIEEKLLEVLPIAFSIIKATAKIFTENESITVKATETDREFALVTDAITIDGDKAIYNTSWEVGGNLLKWNMVHYDTQLIGGVVLHQGKVSEMATGEGKTLVATLPVFLNALSGRGVHVVTVNDYLAKRDSQWMGPLYMFHGLRVDCIDKHQPYTENRRKAYRADITFGTNNEFGFDYLRDNMATKAEDLVQRFHNYAIVDEVDSVLIDDARTPLIISGPVERESDSQFAEFRPIVDNLYQLQRQLVNKLLNEAKTLIAKGDNENGGIALLRSHKALPKYTPIIKFLSEHGVKSLMQKTENTYMADNNRRMHEITDPLYFVIDEKINSVDLTDKGFEFLATAMSDTNFFVIPDIASELSALDKDSDKTDNDKNLHKEEIIQDYSIKSQRIHTLSQLLKAYTMFEKEREYVVIDNKVKIVDEQTGRILDGRRYSDGLHQAIEAKEQVKVEAASQTFASITLQNYFRMYNKLSGMTGTAETEAGEFWSIYKLDVVTIPTNRNIIRDDKQDIVYKTKREKYQYVIEEIVKLSAQGRSVLVGTTSVEISELLAKMLKLRGISHNVLNAKHHQRESEIVAQAGIKGQVTIATNMAGRGTDIKLSPEVKAAGGLAIIGTERHESRRVDRQLRGRAGRQGDPGSSQFFVSLEDDLMRLFGSSRIIGIMDKMGLKDGEMIQHSMISSAIERAQKKVEENNFGMRKRVLEYDDVMNAQRNGVYTKRKHALMGERIEIDINNSIMDVAEVLTVEFDGLPYDEFWREMSFRFSIVAKCSEEEFNSAGKKGLYNIILEEIINKYKNHTDLIITKVMPVFKKLKENPDIEGKNIVVPFNDGVRVYNISVDFNAVIETQGAALIKQMARTVILNVIDHNWKEHLREMDDLKQSVQNASYEQKDPLLIYKAESFKLFETMVGTISTEIVATLLKLNINEEEPPRERVAPRINERRNIVESRDGSVGANTANARKEPIIASEKVGRNDLCPCGSNKKYKQCHGK